MQNTGWSTALTEHVAMKKADLLVSGDIFTGTRTVGAIVVDGGRVVYAGTLESAERVWSCDRRIDYPDGLVMPGLADAHMHLASTGLNMLSADLKGSRSIAEMLQRVKPLVDRDGFAVASGWDQESFEEGRYPAKEDLDSISTEVPIILYRFCFHAAVVNSFVLKAAGITGDTADPPGGIIGRDRDGKPDGMLFDEAIALYIQHMDSELTRSLLPSAVRAASSHAASLGLTTLMTMNADADELDAIRQVLEAGELKCRVRAFLSREALHSLDSPGSGFDGEMVRVSGLKLFADGAFGGRTALLSEPYSDAGTCGLQLLSDEELKGAMKEGMEKGLIVAVHAIGDMGVEKALDAAEELSLSGPGLRIEHVALTPPGVLEKLRRVKPVLVVQPHFIVGDWWITKRLGERSSSCYMFRTFLGMGLEVAGSSDSPVETLDPWEGILAAVDRGKSAGVELASLTASESLSFMEALHMYTGAAGRACGENGVIGSLEEGAYADAVFTGIHVLGAELQRHVAATMVAGRLVHIAEGMEGRFSR